MCMMNCYLADMHVTLPYLYLSLLMYVFCPTHSCLVYIYSLYSWSLLVVTVTCIFPVPYPPICLLWYCSHYLLTHYTHTHHSHEISEISCPLHQIAAIVIAVPFWTWS